MAPLRVLICDDEPLGLDRLRTLIARCDDVAIVGSFLSGRALLEDIQALAPNLILLDIEMPHTDGFDVIEGLSRMTWEITPPLVIFVTAHPEFAVEAFETGALDFIQKPVRLARLEQGLRRARVAAEQMEARQRLRELSEQLEQLKGARDGAVCSHAVWVRKGKDDVRLFVSSIDWIGAEGEYFRFHCGQHSYLERGSLTDAADRFAPYGFVRVHRSAVVNPAAVGAIEKSRWGGRIVRLVSGAQVPVGRKYQESLKMLKQYGV